MATGLEPGKVLVVDDQEIVARVLATITSQRGHTAHIAHDVETALELFERESHEVVLSDVKMGALGGFDLLRRIHERDPDVPVILITGEANVDSAIAAGSAGAFDYISKPDGYRNLGDLVDRALRRVRAARQPHLENPDAPHASLGIVGRSPKMLQAFKLVGRFAMADGNVMILGENGTGKELVARALHDNSRLANRPFVAANMAAIVPTLVESELFGHEKGAFTDARYQRAGLFERANGGTLFLDEIGDMEAALQGKLLRALQERRIQRVGGSEEIPVDIRVISATNRDLRRLIAEGSFREDLYYRLNVFSISLPPLRERLDDIPLLAAHFAGIHARRAGKPVPRVSDAAIARLREHAWPGNVREFDNVIHRATQACSTGIIGVDEIDVDTGAGGAVRRAPGDAVGSDAPHLPLDTVMRQHVLRVLEAADGNRTLAAKILGVSRRTIQRLLRREKGPAAPERDDSSQTVSV